MKFPDGTTETRITFSSGYTETRITNQDGTTENTYGKPDGSSETERTYLYWTHKIIKSDGTSIIK